MISRIILVAIGGVVIWTAASEGEVRADSSLTPPVGSGLAMVVNSWFDHDDPGFGYSGSAYLPFQRYDGYLDNTTNSLCTSQSSCYCTAGVNCYNGHSGVDFSTNGQYGISIVASAPGLVVQVGDTLDGYGTRVRLWHSSLGYATLYGHLSPGSVLVSNGQSVVRRAALGASGCSGICFGAHLHLGALNAQTGGPVIDPLGWSWNGNDPWAAGQPYGNLMAVRGGILSGAQLSLAEGTLSSFGAPLYEYSGVTAMAVAGQRIGQISGGTAWVKDGQWDAQWTNEYSNVSQLALSGRRIAIISGGTARVKQGGLSEQWTSYGCCFSQIAVTHGERGGGGSLPDRVGLLAGTYFFVSEGALGITPTLIATNVKSIALGAGWIGWIDTGNTAYIRETLTGPNRFIYSNVKALALGGGGDDRRIAIIDSSNYNAVKEDAWNAVWHWTTDFQVQKMSVNSGRVAVVTGTSGTGVVKVKEGSLDDQWSTGVSGVSDVKLN